MVKPSAWRGLRGIVGREGVGDRHLVTEATACRSGTGGP